MIAKADFYYFEINSGKIKLCFLKSFLNEMINAFERGFKSINLEAQILFILGQPIENLRLRDELRSWNSSGDIEIGRANLIILLTSFGFPGLRI